MSVYGDSYVLAGFDGPPSSVRALRWAAREAWLRRLPMLVCHAWHPPYPLRSGESPLPAGLRETAQRIVDNGVLIARDEAPHTAVRGLLKAGPALAVLADQSCDAELAVIGAHEATSFSRHASHSPAILLPAFGHCPVIVVRKITRPDGPIVAGVDGSAASEAVLEFAHEEAALHERPVHVIHACGEPGVEGEPGMSAGARLTRTVAGSTLERLTSPWRAKYPFLHSEVSLPMSPPREALLRAAEGAGLLVVGGRRLGDIGGFQLGPVTEAMVREAPCSVAVVRPRR